MKNKFAFSLNLYYFYIIDKKPKRVFSADILGLLVYPGCLH
jgi:hypothetical protein